MSYKHSSVLFDRKSLIKVFYEKIYLGPKLKFELNIPKKWKKIELNMMCKYILFYD